MVIWFTGQPGVCHPLAERLTRILEKYVCFPQQMIVINEEAVRKSTKNHRRHTSGYHEVTGDMKLMARFLHQQGHIVIVDSVSPMRAQRENLKDELKDGMIEIYPYNSPHCGRLIAIHEAPISNFIGIDLSVNDWESSEAYDILYQTAVKAIQFKIKDEALCYS